MTGGPADRQAGLRYNSPAIPTAVRTAMKFNIEKTINASLQDVWSAFDNPDNMYQWQPTLESYEHRHGVPGQPDSVAELTYNEERGKVVLTETVSERREPDFMAGTYESEWARILIVNHFEAIDESTTRWIMYSNMAFKGFMKVMALFMGSSIRKRNDADMERFKNFVEKGSG